MALSAKQSDDRLPAEERSSGTELAAEQSDDRLLTDNML